MTMTPTRVSFRTGLPARGEPADEVAIDVAGNPVPVVTIETITPEDAEKYLARNNNVRKLRRGVVERYASDMADSCWYVGTSVIGFDENDDLRCGQHRLTACVQSGAPFTTIVSRGLTQEAIDNDDQGLKRTTADVLKSKGEIYTQALASVISNSWRWDHGLVLGTNALTQAQISDYLAAHPEVRDATGTAQPLVSGPLGARVSALGPLIFRIQQIEPEFADIFIKSLHTGADLSENDAILRLRQFYLSKRNSPHLKPSRSHELALLVKAWNAWIAGRPVKALRWGRGPSGQEDFPLLIGPSGRPWPFPEVQAATKKNRAANSSDADTDAGE